MRFTALYHAPGHLLCHVPEHCLCKRGQRVSRMLSETFKRGGTSWSNLRCGKTISSTAAVKSRSKQAQCNIMLQRPAQPGGGRCEHQQTRGAIAFCGSHAGSESGGAPPGCRAFCVTTAPLPHSSSSTPSCKAARMSGGIASAGGRSSTAAAFPLRAAAMSGVSSSSAAASCRCSSLAAASSLTSARSKAYRRLRTSSLWACCAAVICRFSADLRSSGSTGDGTCSPASLQKRRCNGDARKVMKCRRVKGWLHLRCRRHRCAVWRAASSLPWRAAGLPAPAPRCWAGTCPMPLPRDAAAVRNHAIAAEALAAVALPAALRPAAAPLPRHLRGSGWLEPLPTLLPQLAAAATAAGAVTPARPAPVPA